MNYENISNDEKMNQINIKMPFDNLKGNYFLQKMFDNMTKNRYLDIIKYNKNLQKRLNLNINDYKDYSQLYSDIIIELIPYPFVYKYGGKFINIWEDKKKIFSYFF